MKLLITLGLLVLASASPQRRQRQRQGRQGYLAPEEVEALASDLDNSYLAPEAADEPLEVYGEEEELEGYGLEAAASDEGVDMGLKMLMTSVPGVPGVPRVRGRRGQALLPLPQRHHLQPGLLHLRLVVQRGLRRVGRPGRGG